MTHHGFLGRYRLPCLEPAIFIICAVRLDFFSVYIDSTYYYGGSSWHVLECSRIICSNEMLKASFVVFEQIVGLRILGLTFSDQALSDPLVNVRFSMRVQRQMKLRYCPPICRYFL